MKETREIIKAVSELSEGETAILATVIDVLGSGYRLPGARMIMLESGETLGTVSGGCLESDVLERAKKVLDTGQSEVFTYDTTGDENSVFSMNMGCRGVIRILLEPIGRDSELITRLRRSYRNKEPQIIATLVGTDDQGLKYIGSRVYLRSSGEIDSISLPPVLHPNTELITALKGFSDSGKRYDFHAFQTGEGNFEFAFERLEPPVSILLFGAGADAIPMARIVSELGWDLTVFDHRPAYLTGERFPTSDRLVLQESDLPIKIHNTDGRCAVVIMTHNYGRDREVLPAALTSNAFYIGALGPRRRTEQLLEELSESGHSFSDEQLARLYAPVGLDTGADTPESIALSIAGEIQSVLADRQGGHLRNRQKSIYDRG